MKRLNSVLYSMPNFGEGNRIREYIASVEGVWGALLLSKSNTQDFECPSPYLAGAITNLINHAAGLSSILKGPLVVRASTLISSRSFPVTQLILIFAFSAPLYVGSSKC